MLNTTSIHAILDEHAEWVRSGGERGRRITDTVAIPSADLAGVDLSYAVLAGINLIGKDLSGVNLSHADLAGARLSGANMSRAKLSGANLSGADLSGAYMQGADLSHACLARADMSKAHLAQATLRGANLINANVFGADLSDANLADANLCGAIVTKANLSGANLTHASLERALCYGVEMASVVRPDVDITGAILTGPTPATYHGHCIYKHIIMMGITARPVSVLVLENGSTVGVCSCYVGILKRTDVSDVFAASRDHRLAFDAIFQALEAAS